MKTKKEYKKELKALRKRLHQYNREEVAFVMLMNRLEFMSTLDDKSAKKLAEAFVANMIYIRMHSGLRQMSKDLVKR